MFRKLDLFPSSGCRSYIGDTGRYLVVQLNQYIHNFKEGLLENSKLAQCAYEEGHSVIWNEEKFLEIKSNSRYKKYKESAL
jgi:hypothetical protein